VTEKRSGELQHRRGQKDVDLPSVLYALDDGCTLGVELLGIALVALLLAIFQSLALVILEQTMLAAERLAAKSAVADDALSERSALLGGATRLLGRHGKWEWRRREKRTQPRESCKDESAEDRERGSDSKCFA